MSEVAVGLASLAARWNYRIAASLRPSAPGSNLQQRCIMSQAGTDNIKAAAIRGSCFLSAQYVHPCATRT